MRRNNAEFVVFKKNKVLKLYIYWQTQGLLVYFRNRMQDKLEHSSSHLKSAHNVAAFQ